MRLKTIQRYQKKKKISEIEDIAMETLQKSSDLMYI